MSGPFTTNYKKHSGAAEATPKPPSEYVAYGAKDHVDRLKIRRANEPTRSPGYGYLLDVVYDGNHGTQFILVFTFMVVNVRGRNLQALISALEMNTADYIQEYDSAKWPMPKDKAAAFIESIKVVTKENGPSFEQSDQLDGKLH